MTREYFESKLEKLAIRYSFHANFGGYSNQDRDIQMDNVKKELNILETSLFSRIEKPFFDEIYKKVIKLKKLVNAEIRNNNRLVKA